MKMIYLLFTKLENLCKFIQQGLLTTLTNKVSTRIFLLIINIPCFNHNFYVTRLYISFLCIFVFLNVYVIYICIYLFFIYMLFIYIFICCYICLSQYMYVSRSVVSDSLQPHRLCGLYPPGSSAHGILQARILKWVTVSFSRGSS